MRVTAADVLAEILSTDIPEDIIAAMEMKVSVKVGTGPEVETDMMTVMMNLAD